MNATCPTEARRDAARKWIQFGQRLDLRKIYARTFIDWDWSEFMDPTDAELPDLAG